MVGRRIYVVYLVVSGLAAVGWLGFHAAEDMVYRRDFDSFAAAGAHVLRDDYNIYTIDPHFSRAPLSSHRSLHPHDVMGRLAERMLRSMADNQGYDPRVVTPGYIFPYLYPPPLAFIMVPFARAPLHRSHLVWLALSLAALIVLPFAAADLARAAHESYLTGFVRALCAVPPFAGVIYNNFYWSQVNVFVVLGVVIAAAWSRRRPVIAGSAFALVAAIKMSPALLGLYFLTSRQWKFIIAAAGAGCVIVVFTLALGGLQDWLDFLAALPDVSRGARMVRGLLPAEAAGNLSLKGFVYRILPMRADSGYDAWVVVLALGLMGRAWWRHGRTSRRQSIGSTLPPMDLPLPLFLYSLVVLMAMLSPMNWYHHLIYLYPAAVLWWQDLSSRGWTGLQILPAVWLPFGLALIPYYAIFTVPPTANWVLSGLLSSWNFYALLLLFFLPDLRNIAARVWPVADRVAPQGPA